MRWIAARLSIGTLLMAFSVFLASTVYRDSASGKPEHASRKGTRPMFGPLIHAYTVYSMCLVPVLVNALPKILSTLSSVSMIWQITEAFMRVTFFDQVRHFWYLTLELTLTLQFVGADLHTVNRGILFTYSIKVDKSEATGASISPSPTTDTPGSLTNPLPLNPADNKPPHKCIVNKMLHCIDIAAEFEVGLETRNMHSPVQPDSGTRQQTWVAMKMTALLPDLHALIAWSLHIATSWKYFPPSTIEVTVSFPGTARIEDMDVILCSPSPNPPSLSTSHPPLTFTQIHHNCELYADLVRICTHAKEKGIKVIVDAEYRYDIFSASYLNMDYLWWYLHSWHQPAIDVLTLALMCEFNSLDQNQSAGGRSGNGKPLVYRTFQAYLHQ